MADDAFRIHCLRSGDVTAVDARSSRAFARHSHEEFGVGLVLSGAQRSWSGRGLVEAGAGRVITVNPAEMHDGAPIGEERSWSILYLSQGLVGSVAEDLSEGRLAGRELHSPVVDDPRAARLFTAARAAALCDVAGEAFGERVLRLFAILFGSAPAPGEIAYRRLVAVRERIDDDPGADHPLAELAALAGLSRFQLLRVFRRATGLTPHAYIVQRRLEMARRLIRAGAPLAEAAAGAAFADQSHFHRIFRARYGFTPGAYAGSLCR